MEYVRTSEVDIDGVKYTIRPLTGAFIGKVYSLLQKIAGFKEDSTPVEVLSALDENTIKNLHTVIIETLKRDKNLPMTGEILDEFVSQNLFKFMGPVIEVNMPKQ